jgi:predicted nucleotidyltransferase
MLSSLSSDAAVRARIATLAVRRGLDLVVLFGSAARGRIHPHSDVDLAVRRAHGCLDGPGMLDLVAELPTALGVPEVDLVDLRAADPLLLRQIFDCSVPLFEEPGAFAAARLHAFHRYEDYRPYLRLERRVVRAALGFHDG